LDIYVQNYLGLSIRDRS